MKIRAGDGFEISFNVFVETKQKESACKGAVLIVPAMGVPQKYYEPLAAWLAGEGYAAATFDYRGMGLSRNGPLRERPMPR